MRDFIKKNELWIFIVLGPIINAFFVYARAQGYMPSYIYNTGRFCVLLILLICILKFTKGNEAIKNLFKPMAKWRVHVKWYILCLTFALAVASCTLLIKGLYYGIELSSLFDFTITTFRGFVALLIWSYLGEVVWVSYCIRELSKIMKPFYAGQIIGIFWTLWFVPIVLLGEGVFPDIPVLSLFIYILGVAGMCTFIYEKTKSGLCVLVLQYMANLVLAALPITPRNGGAPTFTGFAILYFLAMLVIVYFFMKPTKKVDIAN